MLFAAFEVKVLELDRAARYAGRAAKRHEERIVVPAAPGLGAVVAFRRVASEWLSRMLVVKVGQGRPSATICRSR